MPHRLPRSSRRRAVALVLILAVLAVLSTLSVTFVRMMTVERHGARNHVHSVRARMAAESGIAHAISALTTFFQTTAYSGPAQAWVMRDALGVQPDPFGSLEDAIHPSFEQGTYPSMGDLSGLGYSGTLADDGSMLEHSYALRVVDAASKINVNGGDLTAAPTTGYNAVLATLLDNLGLAMKLDASLETGAIAASLGTRLLAARPAGGYARIEDLRAVLGTAEYDQVAPVLTTDSWIDPSTIAPHPNAIVATWTAGSAKPIRQSWNLAVEPRAPIDVNTAHTTVLTAALTGLSARTVEMKSAKLRTVDTPPISMALASAVALAIADRRATIGPFTTWSEWDDFLDLLATTIPALGAVTTDTLVAYRVTVADVIRAATCPNSRLNKHNPNREHAHAVDKSDLVVYTTEFTLQPSGVFAIECLGRSARRGRVIARALVRANVRLYAIARHTTQLDFELARVAADADVASWPERLADSARAAHEDGALLLAPYVAATSSDQTFGLFGAGTLDAVTGSPTAPWATYTEVRDYSPYHAFGKDPIATATDASDLVADGLFTCERRGEQYIFDGSKNRTLVEGSMEFWVKFNWEPELVETTFVDLVNVFAPIDAKTIVSHSFYIKSTGELYSSIYVWDGTYSSVFTGPLSDITGFAPATDLVYRGYQARGYISPSKLNWTKGQWHHIAVRWNDITEHDLYVDGVRMTNTTTQLASAYPLTGSSNKYKGKDMVNHLQVGTYLKEPSGSGSTVKGYLSGTIDDVRLYSTQRFPKGADFSYAPERYKPPVGTGTFTGRFSVPAGARLGTVSWTEYRPRSVYEIASADKGGQRSLVGATDRPDLHVAVRVASSGSFDEVTGSGADGAGATVSGTSLGTVDYRVRFDDAGLAPFNAVPVLDDVTLTYFEAPVILSWEVVR